MEPTALARAMELGAWGRERSHMSLIAYVWSVGPWGAHREPGYWIGAAFHEPKLA